MEDVPTSGKRCRSPLRARIHKDSQSSNNSTPNPPDTPNMKPSPTHNNNVNKEMCNPSMVPKEVCKVSINNKEMIGKEFINKAIPKEFHTNNNNNINVCINTNKSDKNNMPNNNTLRCITPAKDFGSTIDNDCSPISSVNVSPTRGRHISNIITTPSRDLHSTASRDLLHSSAPLSCVNASPSRDQFSNVNVPTSRDRNHYTHIGVNASPSHDRIACPISTMNESLPRDRLNCPLTIVNASPTRGRHAFPLSNVNASPSRDHCGIGSASSTPPHSPQISPSRRVSSSCPKTSDNIRDRVAGGKDGTDLIRVLADFIEEFQFGKGENSCRSTPETKSVNPLEGRQSQQLAGQLRRLADVFSKENIPSSHRKRS